MKYLKGLLKKVYWAINFQYNFNLNGTKLRGLKIYQAKTSNLDEVWMGQILKFLLNRNKDAFLDVGVNIGQTLCQVKSIDVNRDYFGLEPNPACNMFVEELIRINRFPNVKIFPVGIYTEDSLLELDLYYDDLTNSGGSLIKDYWEFSNIKPFRKIIVPLMKYETITKNSNIPKLGIIKIDVEGAELEVLQSLYNKIISDQPTILVEVLSAYSNENTLRVERQEQLLKIILELNYKIFRIIEDGMKGIRLLQQIKNFDPYYDKDQANYILVPIANLQLLEALNNEYLQQ